MDSINIGKIKEAAEEFFGKTGLLVEAIEVKTPQDSTIPINLKSDEPQILIGEGGQTLVELQRLLKLIIKKKLSLDAPFYVDVDVNDYKKKKVEYLKEMARSSADEVSLTKKEKELPIMSAYDRRIIHMVLAERTDVIAESTGLEPERKIIIKTSL